MKKIIDVQRNGIKADVIVFCCCDTKEWSVPVCDLPDYSEPLTADGLTLKEFAFKATSDLCNVQRFDRESMGWKDCQGHLARVVLDMVSIPEIMEIYRIKPEEKQSLSVNYEIDRINKLNLLIASKVQ